MRVAVLCSQRAPGLVELLDGDPRRGSAYEIVCCVTSSDSFAEPQRVERRGVRCLTHSIGGFCAAAGVRLGDVQARAEYDRETLRLLDPFEPDLILLDGYLLVLTRPVLDAFEGRIVNVHHSDLVVRDRSGRPRYPGLRAVRDALAAGEAETRATAHVVTDRLDDGPVLLRSWPFPVPPVVRWAIHRDARDVFRAAAWAHQEWMLREAWTPMLMRSLELAPAGLARPRAPLDVAAIGTWVLTEDGTAVPDITASCAA
jgi:folate-dependent phosphoribosylglycinamide formyltransferase PurN